jgi:hypothetical protein
MAADDDAGQAEALTELRARVAEEHFGDAEYADVLRNQTEDGLRSEAERLRARGLGPSPGNGSHPGQRRSGGTPAGRKHGAGACSAATMPNPAQRQRQHGAVTVTRHRRRVDWDARPVVAPAGPPQAPEHAVPRSVTVAPAGVPGWAMDALVRLQAGDVLRRRYDADQSVRVPAGVAQQLASGLDGWRTL